MNEAIRQRARELGFDDCRFTTAQPPASGPHFRNWLNARNHGEMAYLERTAARRIDPQLVLQDVRSVITLAASYEAPNPQSAIRNWVSSPAMLGTMTITTCSATNWKRSPHL